MFLKVLIASFFCLQGPAWAGCSLGLESEKEASNYNYVIVPGIFNEIVPYYMTEFRRDLMGRGVPRKNIYRINNPSYIKPEIAAIKIKKFIESIVKSEDFNNKKFVFISHSKGALETLYYFIREENSRRVEKIFLIQGSLDGASIYKLTQSKKHKSLMLSAFRALQRISFLADFAESFNFNRVRENLKTLKNHPELLSKVTLIEGVTTYDNLAKKFRYFIGGQYNKSIGRSGDGILLLEDHVPFDLRSTKGLCRKKYISDHSDLVKAAPWRSQRVQRIRSFVKDLLFGFKRDK